MNTSSLGAVLIVVIALGIVIFLLFSRRLMVRSLHKPPAKPAQPDPGTLLVRAYARRDTGDRAGASADFKQVLVLEPDHPDSAAIRAEIEKLSVVQASKL